MNVAFYLITLSKLLAEVLVNKSALCLPSTFSHCVHIVSSY